MNGRHNRILWTKAASCASPWHLRLTGYFAPKSKYLCTSYISLLTHRDIFRGMANMPQCQGAQTPRCCRDCSKVLKEPGPRKHCAELLLQAGHLTGRMLQPLHQLEGASRATTCSVSCAGLPGRTTRSSSSLPTWAGSQIWHWSLDLLQQTRHTKQDLRRRHHSFSSRRVRTSLRTA